VIIADMRRSKDVAKFAAAFGCAFDIDLFASAASAFGRGRIGPVGYGAKRLAIPVNFGAQRLGKGDL
jgi:hypothetical protein